MNRKFYISLIFLLLNSNSLRADAFEAIGAALVAGLGCLGAGYLWGSHDKDASNEQVVIDAEQVIADTQKNYEQAVNVLEAQDNYDTKLEKMSRVIAAKNSPKHYLQDLGNQINHIDKHCINLSNKSPRWQKNSDERYLAQRAQPVMQTLQKQQAMLEKLRLFINGCKGSLYFKMPEYKSFELRCAELVVLYENYANGYINQEKYSQTTKIVIVGNSRGSFPLITGVEKLDSDIRLVHSGLIDLENQSTITTNDQRLYAINKKLLGALQSCREHIVRDAEYREECRMKELAEYSKKMVEIEQQKALAAKQVAAAELEKARLKAVEIEQKARENILREKELNEKARQNFYFQQRKDELRAALEKEYAHKIAQLEQVIIVFQSQNQTEAQKQALGYAIQELQEARRKLNPLPFNPESDPELANYLAGIDRNLYNAARVLSN